MPHRTCDPDPDPDHPGAGLRHVRSGRAHQLSAKRPKTGGAINRQNQLPPPLQAAPLRNRTGDQAILPGHIANPRAGQQALRSRPRFDLIRPPPPSCRPIQNPDARNSLATGNLHPVLILVPIANLRPTQLHRGMPELPQDRNHRPDPPLAKQCGADCHVVGEAKPLATGQRAKLGPPLKRLFGRMAASLPDFHCSDAMRATGIT